MKKLLLLLFLFIISFKVQSQISIDSLITNIDWYNGIEGVEKRFSNNIIRIDHISLNDGKIYADYKIDSIYIGKEYTSAIFYVDSLNPKRIRQISLRFKNKNELIDEYSYIKDHLINLFGYPSMDEKIYGFITVWFKNYLSIKAISSDILKNVCSIKISNFRSVEPIFRGAKFGDTYQEILDKEAKVNNSSRRDYYTFNDYVMGAKCDVSYLFADNVFAIGEYCIKENYSNPNDYIELYDMFKNALTSKYGSPDKDEIIWKDNLFKKSKKDFGLAIGAGHLKYKAKWKTPDCDIKISLAGNNYDIELEIQYSCEDTIFLINSYFRKDDLNKL